ncbi:MAG: SAM-dependent methyltransferase [Gammaproteobacteria bacterium]
MTIPLTLPTPDPAAAAHSARLAAVIRAEIAQCGGALPFARFMELALYAPGLGYYSAGARKFGATGDFVTAPEITPLFARCLARQCQEILAHTGATLFELGAGSGIMAADLLRELETLDSLPERYLILELSADLRARQRATIVARVPHLAARVQWLERLPDEGIRGVIIANEVLDALPVQRFRITARGPRLLTVGWNGMDFDWRESEPDRLLTAAISDLQNTLAQALPQGYESEFCDRLPAWIGALAAALAQGVLLFIDYGYGRDEYYHPERRQGTLICHYRHRAHADPLILVGLQDISASVDFSAVAAAAVGAGLALAGFTSQADFLLSCGLLELLAETSLSATRAYLAQAQTVKRLILPGEMGERFKAIALTRGLPMPLRGFSRRTAHPYL